MRIRKIITTAIDIYNVIALYTDDNNLISILREKFERKCFRSCYILTVDRIIDEGRCMMKQEGAPDFGTIPVSFEVTAIQYNIGEVITGCKVLKKDKTNQIICEVDNTSIIIKPSPYTESIVDDQIISVQVLMARYSISSNTITVGGVLYLPSKTAVVYKVDANDVDQSMLMSYLERLKEEEQHDRTSASYKVFNRALYPFETQPPAPPGSKLVTYTEMIASPPKYVACDPSLPIGDKVYVYDIYDGKVNDTVSGTAALQNVLNYLAENLRVARELVSVYKTPEMIDKHNNLWMLFAKNKK